MKRAIRFAALCAIVLSGCIQMHVHVGVVGDDVSGRFVEQAIDTRVVPVLWLRDKTLHPAASCPERLDLSVNRIGRCVIRSGGTELPITVALDSRLGISIRLNGSLVVAKYLEQYVEKTVLRDYGVAAVATCGKPRVWLVMRVQHFGCRIQGRGIPGFITGNLTANPAHSTADINVRPFDDVQLGNATLVHPYVVAHSAGRPAVMRGSQLAAVVRDTVLATGPSAPELLHGMSVTCPAQADLTAEKYVRCTVKVSAGTMIYNAWIETSPAFRVQAQNFLVSTKSLAEQAEQFYDYGYELAGQSSTISVDCGRDRAVVVTRTTTIVCRSRVGDTMLDLTVYFPDFPESVTAYDLEPRGSQ